ncbi:MAG: hypothetical protein LBN04_05745 [Oscillospiraceae bacterium]|jgi:hypothetical protein|nr:hypothetical protein [Oscillospiraceae bacterium]
MDIEQIATSTVKGLLSITDLLKPAIKELDREPIFDGCVHVFSHKSQKSEFLRGRIPVQVKGKEVNDTDQPETKFAISTTDIRAFLSEGGGVYFVVLISHDGRETKLFYVNLLPYKAKRFLDKAGKNKSRTTLLRPFPVEKKDIEEWALNFILHSQNQRASMISVPTLQELSDNRRIKEIRIPFMSTSPVSNPYDYLVSHETYIYAVTQDGVMLPVEYLDPSMSPAFFHSVDRNVCIGDDVFYTHYLVETSAEKLTFSIGKSIKIDYIRTPNANLYTRRFRIKISGTLNERITDMSFVYRFLNEYKLSIAGISLDFTSANKDANPIDKDKIKMLLEKYELIRRILDAAGVFRDIDYSVFVEKDLRLLSALSPALIDGIPIPSISKEFNDLRDFDIVTLSSPNLRLMLTVRRQADNQYVINDFFRQNIPFGTEVDGEMYIVSQYCFFTSENYIETMNIDYLAIKDSVLEPPPSIAHWGQTNKMLLNVLLAYDKSPCNSASLIDLAKFLAQWLLDNSDEENSYVATINNLQVHFRERVLSNEEVAELHSIVEASNDEAILFGAYVLLRDRVSAQKHFDRIEEEYRDDFITYPIYNIYKTI